MSSSPLSLVSPDSDPARVSALRRIRQEELERQEAVIRDFELERLKAIFAIRAMLQQYGLSRVETWVANQAQELGL